MALKALFNVKRCFIDKAYYLDILRFMKRIFLFILLVLQTTVPFLFAQRTATLAPDAANQLDILLNNPVMVSPASATPLGGNWFRFETDIHVFTDQVSFRQVAGVFLDLKNIDKTYYGKKSSLAASIVSKNADETIVDFVSVSIGPFGIKYRTPYRASVKPTVNTDTKISNVFTQLASDSFSNRDMKNFYSTQFAEEVTINGKKYTYIRVYMITDIYTSLLPRAKNTLEREASPVNIEKMKLIINAAKKYPS